MISYTRRCTGGDHERVWSALRHLGPIPACLDACLRLVGGASFDGDCPAPALRYAAGDRSPAAAILRDPLEHPALTALRARPDF